jgi:hypothetical protein
MLCQKCGAQMAFAGKDTFSGREIREYRCLACGHEDSEDRGIAMWVYMQDASREDEAATRLAEDNPGSHAQPLEPQSVSKWSRLLTRLTHTRKK